MQKGQAKILCLFLSMLTVLFLFSACGKKGPDAGPGSPTSPGGDRTDQTTEPGVETDENGYELDSIDRTLGGREVKLLLNTTLKTRLMPESHTEGKSVVSDALYLRNKSIEERLDVFFKPSFVAGEWKDATTFLQTAEKCGDHGFDLIVSHCCFPAELVVRGLLVNMNTLAYPELDKPWWPDETKEYEQFGALYFINDNSSVRMIETSEVVFVDHGLVEANGLKSVEELVIDYEWTVDKMIEYANYVQTDLDVPADQRKYGLVVDHSGRMDAFFYGSGLRCTQKNNSGCSEIILSTDVSVDKVTNLLTKMSKIAQYSNFIITSDYSTLTQNRTMFEVCELSKINTLTDRTYSVVPIPMYDSEQKEYKTVTTLSIDMWCIPTSAGNYEDSGLVIEAFASSDYRTIAPFYYEERMKLRYSDSRIGEQIFDIIRYSTVVDFGRVCAYSAGVLEEPFRKCFYKSGATVFQTDYTSFLDTQLEKVDKKYEQLLAAYRKYAS